MEKTKNISEGVFGFWKQAVDAGFETAEKIQTQTEKVMSEAVETGKKGWAEYKKAVADGFKKAEDMIQSLK